MTPNPPLLRWLCCAVAVTHLDAAEPKAKKLIEFGSDEPGTEFLREHITADEYVWIYTETPRWWSKEGGPVKLPKAYEEAVRKAR